MKHVEAYIGEYLRGELGRRQTDLVAGHLSRCPHCAAYADWLAQLEGLAAEARREPPTEVVEALEARLLTLPGRLASGTVTATLRQPRAGRTIAFPDWLSVPDMDGVFWMISTACGLP